MNKLNISISPHIHCSDSIDRRMWNVVIAMIPALVVALWSFGLPALWTTLLCVVSCLLTEWVVNRFMFHRPLTLTNGSALITGLLLAFNLPCIIPWWMAIIGSIVAIGIAKMSFGGLGCNIWNPALVGRVFLLISFPAAMTTWPTGVESGYDTIAGAAAASGASAHADASTGATLLTYLNSGHANLSEYNFLDMAVGQMNGSLGEVGGIAILIGLAYMLAMRTITWHIPLTVIGSAALFSWAFGGNPLLDIFAGGLLLGAVFMATDYVTSPMTHIGQFIYGFMIGFITIIIRRFGAYPEGMSFAILLMNSFVPLINKYCRPKIFGEKERRVMA
ncbi:MAG: RnfABCDGE type electron transport complex subunit D [Bacteroides sp.]|nr:RnfABCDGE type electron transport complex subunit D [Bacteroides sp.]